MAYLGSGIKPAVKVLIKKITDPRIAVLYCIDSNVIVVDQHSLKQRLESMTEVYERRKSGDRSENFVLVVWPGEHVTDTFYLSDHDMLEAIKLMELEIKNFNNKEGSVDSEGNVKFEDEIPF